MMLVRASFVLRLDQAARNQFARIVALCARPTPECVPLVRRVAQLPALRDFRRDATPFEVLSRRFADLSLDQILMEPFRSFTMKFQQHPACLVLSIFNRGATLLHHCDADSRSEFVHG